MSKYIDLDKVMEHCGGGECLYCPFCLQQHSADYCMLEYDLPTIEIVRCSECKYREKCEQIVAFEIGENQIEGRKIDFCSYGERIEK